MSGFFYKFMEIKSLHYENKTSLTCFSLYPMH